MLRRIAFLALLGLLAIFGGRLMLLASASGAPAASELPRVESGKHRAALVLGAGLNANGTPSPVLRDRIRAGVELLRAGKVDLLLMSGDNSVDRYSEPTAMRRAALDLGAPDEQIAVDYGGRRTWDSCKRAHDIFGVRHVIVVTNDFHRARAVVLCARPTSRSKGPWARARPSTRATRRGSRARPSPRGGASSTRGSITRRCPWAASRSTRTTAARCGARSATAIEPRPRQEHQTAELRPQEADTRQTAAAARHRSVPSGA